MSIAPRAAHLGPPAILLLMCLRLGSRPAERKLDSGVSMQPSLPFQNKREKRRPVVVRVGYDSRPYPSVSCKCYLRLDAIPDSGASDTASTEPD